MAIVVGSPIPAAELGRHLDGILTTVQMEWQTRLAVTVFLFYEYFLTLDQEVEYVWVFPLLYGFSTTQTDKADKEASLESIPRIIYIRSVLRNVVYSVGHSFAI
ncbi:hypothetical protein SCLCIDRAFT_1215069 [Scleroderma citrinum Foug A]|uniref:DUF6533 domain-containing protein n=1 Tax=Scleroderma citrinum Foug A TaxID=1036808 RepID=A0A0C3AC36_9AGAM|nr:hypothetical protein SCLCIDRAFT_1215069 [Scleroderma citrinum Foug A]